MAKFCENKANRHHAGQNRIVATPTSHLTALLNFFYIAKIV